MRSVVIVNAGSGGQASVVLDACLASEVPVAGWITASEGTRNPGGDLRMLGDLSLLQSSSFLNGHEIIVATGNGDFRRTLSERAVAHGGVLATVRHPTSVVSAFSEIGEGSFLAAHSFVGPHSRVGRYCIINTAATIDHDNLLADGVNVSPGVHCAGNVQCDVDAFIGVGASVAPGVRIGARAIVGAGAVVIRDVAEGTTVVGNPAREMKRPGPAE